MTIRAGVAGLGRWGQTLVNSVQGKSDAITFVAGCTGRKDRARDFCTEAGIDLRDGLDDLLADDSIDAVVLATPNLQHADQITAAAAAGKHVFVEKPFTMTKDSAEAAAQACAEANVVCALGHNRRFLPAMKYLRDVVNSGDIGTPLHVEANISIPAGYRHGNEHWRANPEECPAGGMTALGVHMTDALISFLGPVKEVTVTSERRVLDIPIDDVTFMTMRFESGMTGYMSTIFVTSPVWFIRVMGDKGWANMRGYERVAVRKNVDDEETLTKFDKPDIERAELEAFAEAASGGTAYPIPVSEAVHGTALVHAIFKSAENGGTVSG